MDREAKIKKLREIWVGEENSRAIDDLEKRLREAIKRQKLSEIPEIENIIKDAKQRVNQINTLLSYDETLTDYQRHGLYRERDVWQFNLDRFGVGEVVNEQLASLDSFVEEKLKGK